jgi:acetyl-CoA carboxylase biotin carboxyl carrier protein
MNDELIIALIEKFNAGSVAELEYNDERTHLVLRKESALGKKALHTEALHTEVVRHEHKEDFHSTSSTPVHAEAKHISGAELITSPIVATFYASAGPDAPPFVSVGTILKAGSTFCILEAMKMMNHLEAEYDCEILSIKAKSGDLVEFGQTLFEVKRL